ncbi:MAG: LCP family protein [Oscillatoriales cyanobacterium SM2_1_8]|nr:LCP family protein [Oscillatoriales cyanobacterium SM2_1_8]
MTTAIGAGRTRVHFRLSRVGFGVMTAVAIAGGTLLAKVLPFTAIDWNGLAQGRSPAIVLWQGLGYRLTQPYQILVMGVDRVPTAPLGSPAAFDGRSDTMVLVRIDPQAKEIRGLSIPRDTQTWIAGYGTVKINAANVYGGRRLAVQTVRETLANVQIDRVVRIDTEALVTLIDAVGGVELTVPQRMQYRDRTQNLEIDLQPGPQTLTGRQAEGFARFRNDAEGDIGRIRRQQTLLRALKTKIQSLPWWQWPDLLTTLQTHIDTDLTDQEARALLGFLLEMKGQRIPMESLGGRPSADYEFEASYWLTDNTAIERAIAGKFERQPSGQNF